MEAGTLAVRRLALTEFRSYAAVRIETAPSPVVLVGPNGAGKTNLLEAVSLLVPGRGLRRARLADLRRRPLGADAAAADAGPAITESNATEPDAAEPNATDPAVIEGAAGAAGGGGGRWGIAARLDTPSGSVDIGTGGDPSAPEGSDRRLVRIDGVAARSQTVLAEHAAAVWLTPQMDRLFIEGASERRRFLDRLVFGLDAAHAARVSGYENAMRQRSRLLRDGPRDASWLKALEEMMASRGVAVAVARRSLTDRLEGVLAEPVSAFPSARVTADGTVEAWLAEMPAEAAEARFREALLRSRARDGESGGAAVGPHRSDMQVIDRVRGVVAASCSTGEQKALLISLVLGAARLQAERRGAAPLLLLDEVAAHLDAGRRAALFDEILALGGQAWLTGTDAEIFAPFGTAAQRFRVQQSTVVPI